MMVIIRDEQRIARLRKAAQWLSLAGFIFLLAGLGLIFMDIENLVFYQLLALSAGWILSQIGTFLAHRYLRKPRPDEVLDEAVQKMVRNGRMYHYVLPVPHLLLTPDGIIIFVAKFQTGKISVEDGDKWKQKGIGLRKYFGQEGLGNPTQEAESMVKAVASFINKHAPGVQEVPIGALIVFTTKNIKDLDIANSRIPAMHFTKIKGFLKQKKRGAPMSAQDYEAIRAAFDQEAGELVPQGQPAKATG